MFTVSLPEDLGARLNKAAQELGVSRSRFARDAIAYHMTKWEEEFSAEREVAEVNSSLRRN